MKLEIDQADFQRFSPQVQRELIETLAGARFLASTTHESAGLRWRLPVSLTHDQAVKLVHGLSEDYRQRVALFTRKSGRVTVKEILALTGENDLRATTEFIREMTRRLRRIIQDPEKKAQLIGWDFEATKWDENQTTIVDGVYYVTEATAEALRSCLGRGKGGSRKA